MVPLSVTSALIFSAIMGLLWLGTVPLTSGLVAQIFGPRYMATLFGIVFFSHQVGSFLGVWLGGYLYDTHGSYDLIWWLSIALGLVAALLHWPIDERTVARLRARPRPRSIDVLHVCRGRSSGRLETHEQAVVVVGQEVEEAVGADPDVANPPEHALQQPLLVDHLLAVELEPRQQLAGQARRRTDRPATAGTRRPGRTPCPRARSTAPSSGPAGPCPPCALPSPIGRPL